MLVLGHAGSWVDGLQNTASGVLRALAGGADGVEVDVRRCADGLVLAHDPQAAGLPLLTTTLADLAAAGVPSAAEVLDLARGRGRVVLEVKNQAGEPDFDAPREATARKLLALLEARGPGDDVVVSSFNWFAIEAVRDAGRGLRTGFLTAPGVAVQAGVAYAVEKGHDELHAHTSVLLDVPGAARRVHDAGLVLVAYTAADAEMALRLRDVGVDAVICDDPVAVRRALT